MHQVTKLEMAVQQLEDALEAYFHQRYFSAIVLSGAAEQLLAGYVQKHGMRPSWSQMRTAITRISNGLQLKETGLLGTTTEDDIGDIMNRAYNAAKHAGKKPKDHLILMDPKFEACEVIDRAISNYDALLGLPDYDLPEIKLAQLFRQESTDGIGWVESEAAEVLLSASAEREA